MAQQEKRASQIRIAQATFRSKKEAAGMKEIRGLYAPHVNACKLKEMFAKIIRDLHK
jgi:hypothetical protein